MKKLTLLLLTGALICAFAMPALADVLVGNGCATRFADGSGVVQIYDESGKLLDEKSFNCDDADESAAFGDIAEYLRTCQQAGKPGKLTFVKENGDTTIVCGIVGNTYGIGAEAGIQQFSR